MLQSDFLHVLNKVGLFLLQLTGLWPFAYNPQSKKFKFLWYFTIIPMIIIGYPLVVVFFWSKHVSKEIYVKNAVVTVLSVGFIAFNALNFVILFISQYLKFNEIKDLIRKSRRLIRQLNNELDRGEFKYGDLLLKFTAKTIFFMSILVYSIAQSMTRYSKFEENFVTHIVSVLPNIIMKLHPDIFYGGLLVINFYLTQINSKVSSVLTKAKDLSENDDLNEQKRYQKMINFCELSDQLDRLCTLQCNVINISATFTRICSFQITLWIALGLCVFLINMFQEYITISTAIKMDDFSLQMFINDLISICLIISEIYFTTSMSDNVMAEVSKAFSFVQILKTQLNSQNFHRISLNFKIKTPLLEPILFLDTLKIILKATPTSHLFS